MNEPSVDTRNNSGHFDAEVNIPALARMTKGNLRLRPFLDDGRILGVCPIRCPPSLTKRWPVLNWRRWDFRST